MVSFHYKLCMGAHKQMEDSSRTLEALRVQFQCMDVKIHTSYGQLDVRMAGVCEELACVRESAACVREDVRDIRECLRELEKKLDALLKRGNERSIWD